MQTKIILAISYGKPYLKTVGNYFPGMENIARRYKNITQCLKLFNFLLLIG